MGLLVGISKLRPGSSEQGIGAMRLGDTMLKELGQAMSVTGHVGRLLSDSWPADPGLSCETILWSKQASADLYDMLGSPSTPDYVTRGWFALTQI